METQSVMISKKYFTLPEAKKWIRSHGYKTYFGKKKVDITENNYRFRQKSPKKGARYRIKQITKGVKLVLMLTNK